MSLFTFIFVNSICVTVAHGANCTELQLDGTCIEGVVSEGSDALYYFQTPANGTVRLGVDNNNLQFGLYRNLACTSQIALSSTGYADLRAGTYYVKVTGAGPYKISANFSEMIDHDKEPNDTMETAIPLVSGVQMKGNVYSAFNDLDWYKFELTTKSYIDIDLNTNGQSIFIFDANGNYVSMLRYSGPVIIDNPGEYYIRVSTSGNSYGYYELKGDIVEFPTPNEITKAVYKGSRKVDLTWSKSNYADGYRLFYKTSKDGEWKQIITINSGNTTSYTHSYGPSAGQTYYYGVQAFRKCDCFGEIYNQEDATGFKVTAPKLAVVSDAKATIVSGKAIQVSWKVSGKVDGFKIYRKANGGSYKLVKTISSGSTLKWQDTGIKKGTYYTYKVVISGVQSYTGYSDVTGKVKLTGTLSRVTGVKGKKYTYKIKAYYKNYTYSSSKKTYISKTVTSDYSKTVSLQR